MSGAGLKSFGGFMRMCGRSGRAGALSSESGDLAAGGCREPFYVVVVTGEYHTLLQATPELGLSWRTADLGYDRSGHQGNSAEFQASLVVSPRPPVASVRGCENG